MSKSTKSIAAKAATKAVAVSQPSRSLALVDQELANEVAQIKQQIGQPSGRRLKVEPKGSFTTPDGLDLGDEIQVIVLDFVTRHQFYTQPYNPQQPSPPDCYAIGKIVADLAPENDSPDKQSDKCSTCPLNQFGSGSNGKSKACKNTRELAVLLVDPENPDAHNADDAPIYQLSLPPTAIRSFDGAVSKVAQALGGPPIKAIMSVSAQNVGTYAAITFSSPVANPDYAQHLARRSECQDLLFRKPDFSAAAQPKRAPARQPLRAGARR